MINIRKKVKELRSKASSDEWHRKLFNELSLSMKKDEVYHTGAKDVILFEYITNALENQTDQDDYGTIKTRFRDGLKIFIRLSDSDMKVKIFCPHIIYVYFKGKCNFKRV